MQFFKQNHSSSAISPDPEMPQLRWEECGVTPGRAQHPLKVTNARGTQPWMGREARATPSEICMLHSPQLWRSLCFFELPLLSAPSQLVFQDWQGLGGESRDAHTHQTCQHLCKTLLLMLNMCCTHSAPTTNPLKDLQGSARVTGLTREMQTRHLHPT